MKVVTVLLLLALIFLALRLVRFDGIRGRNGISRLIGLGKALLLARRLGDGLAGHFGVEL